MVATTLFLPRGWLSNDVNFEPYRDIGLEGQRLEATR
jgi:hypothetical protein